MKYANRRLAVAQGLYGAASWWPTGTDILDGRSPLEDLEAGELTEIAGDNVPDTARRGMRASANLSRRTRAHRDHRGRNRVMADPPHRQSVLAERCSTRLPSTIDPRTMRVPRQGPVRPVHDNHIYPADHTSAATCRSDERWAPRDSGRYWGFGWLVTPLRSSTLEHRADALVEVGSVHQVHLPCDLACK